jgi:hypothetical protein
LNKDLCLIFLGQRCAGQAVIAGNIVDTLQNGGKFRLPPMSGLSYVS